MSKEAENRKKKTLKETKPSTYKIVVRHNPYIGINMQGFQNNYD